MRYFCFNPGKDPRWSLEVRDTRSVRAIRPKLRLVEEGKSLEITYKFPDLREAFTLTVSGSQLIRVKFGNMVMEPDRPYMQINDTLRVARGEYLPGYDVCTYRLVLLTQNKLKGQLVRFRGLAKLRALTE